MDNDELKGTAYIVVSNANCLYEPDVRSAVRVIPPYGAEVVVIRSDGAWVLIQFCGKQAWALRTYLSTELTPQSSADEIGTTPFSSYKHRISRQQPDLQNSAIEYGPRGGRFVRTSSGFRRYL